MMHDQKKKCPKEKAILSGNTAKALNNYQPIPSTLNCQLITDLISIDARLPNLKFLNDRSIAISDIPTTFGSISEDTYSIWKSKFNNDQSSKPMVHPFTPLNIACDFN